MRVSKQEETTKSVCVSCELYRAKPHAGLYFVQDLKHTKNRLYIKVEISVDLNQT